ncbi:hypothetical protein BO94DRAFT_286254 [Aspergillus sclerotioniger CBS 115572]|uniref:Regulator of phospholipase D SRF1 n=1 Tax=Aspergillus sclerotioniger CBS 115572 TaxID=1450535 RepID=A0A317XB23_9EURO|nr:hypothetical protein BO94DRAFT_286254 [Aspergillus sclerotioniger CBS 115572]PWY94852.1 hypothetical protein BO94DRAFT_286254 [Aspergillus sclerotioniger CBS 115572]
MAQDVRDTRLQPPDAGPLSDEQLSEQPSAPEWMSAQSNYSTGALHSDNDLGHHDAVELSAGNSRSPESTVVGEIENSPAMGRKPRTLPAWIRSVEYTDDDAEAAVTDRLLPMQPGDAVVAQHNHSPYATSRPTLSSGQGEGSDRNIGRERESRWKNFSRDIVYPREQGVEEKIVTPDWLEENVGDYSQPWRGQLSPDEDTEDPLRKRRRREIWIKRFHNTLLKSPMVPLIFRLTVWCFSLTALALGGSIQHLSGKYKHPQGPSALMAIIVDAVALVYLIYITFDEYTSKPLGLRSPSAKARLILLDIFFIVFDSANLSLAFESLSTVRGACTMAEVNQEVAPKNDAICDRQIALACVLLIALIAWLTTFSISVLRLVERVAS